MNEQRKQVLVIDDDPEIRTLLGPRFERSALTADFMTNGIDALDAIEHTTYSVVLLNIGMPGVNGATVLERLNASERTSPVVLVMTTVQRAILEQFDPNRIHGVLRKPIDPDELVALVRECVDIKSRVFGAMAVASVLACGPILALLSHLAQQ